MSSMKLEPLIKEFPEERAALERLDEVVGRLQHAGTYKELTLDRLFELSEPSSQRVLVAILGRLCQQGVFERLVRVYSESGAVADFPSLLDVPVAMEDWRTGRQVRTDDLKLIYTIRP